MPVSLNWASDHQSDNERSVCVWAARRGGLELGEVWRRAAGWARVGGGAPACCRPLWPKLYRLVNSLLTVTALCFCLLEWVRMPVCALYIVSFPLCLYLCACFGVVRVLQVHTTAPLTPLLDGWRRGEESPWGPETMGGAANTISTGLVRWVDSQLESIFFGVCSFKDAKDQKMRWV